MFQIYMSFKDHQRAFSPVKSRELCYTYLWSYAYRHVDMVETHFCFDDFYILFFAEFSYYFSYILFQRSVYSFSAVLRGKHNVILTSVT